MNLAAKMILISYLIYTLKRRKREREAALGNINLLRKQNSLDSPYIILEETEPLQAPSFIVRSELMNFDGGCSWLSFIQVVIVTPS